ncbi:hypothetical protein [Flavobacterium daemonense]|uniref:hypothetical protein n=1 Tax=Flavobacterium daemonense TaxID=1393049 RepID=UPI001184F6E8|nr:hypothetical protein [Flavobacterium daemonense]KAF2327269.1 hypothetical protein FND99_18900 [Flavobacterium daemonense]
MKNLLLWIIAFPFAIIASSLISSAYSYIVSLVISEPKLFTIFGTYIQFFAQGILFVTIVYFIVPNYKLKSAFVAFFVFTAIMLVSEFYLKKLYSEPLEITKMCISIAGSLLGYYNMTVMGKADKSEQK